MYRIYFLKKSLFTEESKKHIETKPPNVTTEEKRVVNEPAVNITTDVRVNSIHIKEEPLSIINNKTGETQNLIFLEGKYVEIKNIKEKK